MSGPIAVVTGAGSGIGAAISGELAQRGFAVIPTDVDETSAARTATTCGAAASYVLDVRDAEAVTDATANIVEQPRGASSLGLERRRVQDAPLLGDNA